MAMLATTGTACSQDQGACYFEAKAVFGIFFVPMDLCKNAMTEDDCWDLDGALADVHDWEACACCDESRDYRITNEDACQGSGESLCTEPSWSEDPGSWRWSAPDWGSHPETHEMSVDLVAVDCGFECPEAMDCGFECGEPECVADCDGKECGNDGCGGTCGGCDDGWLCKDGVCQFDCPSLECVPGTFMCNYAGKKYRDCLPVMPECPNAGEWSEYSDCPFPRKCISKTEGCVCLYGECEPDIPFDASCGGVELGVCGYWECQDGCCVDAYLEIGTECCTMSADCRDCIDPSSGDTVMCPEGIPNGHIENLCTQNACVGFECVSSDKVESGQCDDDSACTLDGCDPVSGGCTHEQVDCDDGNPCTTDGCDHTAGCWSVDDNDNPCDDSNPDTANKCVDGECVVVY